MSHVAATTASTANLLHQVVRECASLVDVERCGVYMRDDRDELFRAWATCAKGFPLTEDVSRWRAGVPEDGLTREVVTTREPVVVSDALHDPRMIQAAVSRWSIRSIMAVPMVFEGEVIGLLMMDDIGRARDFKLVDVEVAATFADFASATVAQTEERLKLRHRLGLASRRLTAARRGADVDEQVGNLVRQGRSLEEITSRVAQLLDKPCAVYREDGEQVATARPEATAPLERGASLAKDLLAQPEVRSALAENEGDRAFLLGPIAAAKLRRRHAVAPVRVGDELWGRLVVMEQTTPLSGTEIGAVRRAAMLIGLRVDAERQGASERWEATSTLTADLLRGGVPAAEVRDRAMQLGISLDAKRVVALFASPGNERELDAREVALALREHTPDLLVHVAPLAGAVAAMIEVAAEEDAAAFLGRHRERLEAVRTSLGAEAEPLVAISGVHRWADGYQLAYGEARQVLECIRRFSTGPGPRLLSAQDLGGGGLFLSTSDGVTMSRFAESTVGKLLDADSNSDLMLTLRVFFEQLCSVRRTANALGIHENTVRYRLGRVEEETGLAVMRDPDAQVGARLALLILVLRGRLPADPPAIVAANEDDDAPPR